MKKTLLVLGAFLIYSCTTAPVAPPPTPAVVPAQPTSFTDGTDVNIDLLGLQDYLKLNRKFDQLGYSEKVFNTCEVGYGYSSTHNCRQKTFVVIQFQLMCRGSEGTVSQILTQSDLRPISRQNVKWTLKKASGKLITDSEGYAQIGMVSPESQRLQRLRLTVGNDFLVLRAGEITQMVTPKSWCN